MPGPSNQPFFPEIAGGSADMTGAANGDKLQGVQGAECIKVSTGLMQVTLLPPNAGLGSTEVFVSHNPGFGTSKGGGGMSTTMSSNSAGIFNITLWDQTTVPPVEIDGDVHFTIKRKYPDR